MEKFYSPSDIEKKWAHSWEESQVFSLQTPFSSTTSSFATLLPPPNVTGNLHMGHALNHTLIDCLCRFHRMRGATISWRPGTDHAGIATQMVVERQLQKKGINKKELSRKEFLNKIWEWKANSSEGITTQMKRMGSSCDWSQERFTMDPDMNHLVTETFVHLYEQGLIYRGTRLVNWDPHFETAVSDIEVITSEENRSLYYIQYFLASGEGSLVIATTRPETLFADAAIAVHPDDSRFARYIGQNVLLPITGRAIPIIQDDTVDKEFGTGCLKITPAHDFHDYEIGRRHKLPFLSILTKSAHLNEHVPEGYQGLSVIEARKKIITDLKNSQQLLSEEHYRGPVPRGDRSGAILEPFLTKQWFMDLTQTSQEDGKDGGNKAIVQPALEVVNNGDIMFFPENWGNTYKQWLENIQDWCLSRQLWWGHRIPAWYGSNHEVFVALNEDLAYEKAKKAGYIGTLTQDEDVLDTWFSSSLWAFSTLDWRFNAQSNVFIDKFLPAQVLITGFDIIFFWVARMVMMTIYCTGKIPFKHVYIHGLVRDHDGQKMSKSKGNVLDPLDIVNGISLDALLKQRSSFLMTDIHKARVETATRKEFPNGIPSMGVDAIRLSLSSMATPGHDVRCDLQKVESYKNFCNKLWNATRFVLMTYNNRKISINFHEAPRIEHSSDIWILNRLQETSDKIIHALNNYRFDFSVQELYQLVWWHFCDWFLEIAKARMNQAPDDTQTIHQLLYLLQLIIRLAHPFMPFITEELWLEIHQHCGLSPQTLVAHASFPSSFHIYDDKGDQWFENISDVIGVIRQLRADLGVSPQSFINVYLEESVSYSTSDTLIIKNLARLQLLESGKLPSSIKIWSMMSHNGVKVSIATPEGTDDQEVKLRLSRQIEKAEKNISLLEKRLSNPAFREKSPIQIVQQDEIKLRKEKEKKEKLSLILGE